MVKLVPCVADVPVDALLGVVEFPVSSNSTVGANAAEGGVMVWVTLFVERVAVAVLVGPNVLQGPLASTVILVNPVGTEAVPLSMHHSYAAAPSAPAPSPPEAV